MKVYVLVPGFTEDFDPVAVFSDIKLAEENHTKYGGVLYTFELDEPPFKLKYVTDSCDNKFPARTDRCDIKFTETN